MALVLRDPDHSNGGLIFAGQEELSGNAYSITPSVTVIVAPLGATMAYFAAANAYSITPSVTVMVAPLGATMAYFAAASELIADDAVATALADGALSLGGEATAEVVGSAVVDVATSLLRRMESEVSATSGAEAAALRAAAQELVAELIARSIADPLRYIIKVEVDPTPRVWVAKGRSAKWRAR